MKLNVKIPILHSFFMNSTTFGKLRSQYKCVLSLLYISLFSTMLAAQEAAPGRIPVYPVPYEYPAIDGIKGVLNRVRVYYDSVDGFYAVFSVRVALYIQKSAGYYCHAQPFFAAADPTVLRYLCESAASHASLKRSG